MKILSFILALTLVANLLAQDCNNPLLQTFDLTGLASPQSGQGLPYCSNLQSGQSCCSSETVQSFQSRLNSLTTSLQELAGQRDAYMVQLYANYSSDFQRAVDDLTDYSDEITRIERQNATLGNEIRSQYRGLNRIDDALDNIDDNFRSSVQEYQERRANCFTTVLRIQASAWCLACDPNYASLGVRSDGSVDSSTSVCNAIVQACASYVQRADNLNPLWQARQAYRRLLNLTRYLRNYRANNFVLDEDVILNNDIRTNINATRRTSALPRNCNASSCEWQCNNFFSSDLVLNNTIVANGGGIIGGDDINYPPVGVNAPAGRLLQSLQESVWTPNLEGTGLTIVVAEDPGEITAVIANNPVFANSDNDATDNPNTQTDNDDGFTDNDGFNTQNDQTDNDGINTPNDLTDNDGINTAPTDNDGINTPTDNDGINTPTDNDGINTLPTDNDGINTPTDNDGINTPNDQTDNDGINTPNDLTDNDGINTAPTDNDGINTPTDNDGINTPTDNDGINTPNDQTDGDGINTPPTLNDETDNNN